MRIGLAGATGALGREVLEVLDKAPWRPDEVVPLASRACTVPFVQWGEEQVAVDDLRHQALEELDAIILATPPEVALEYGEAAMREGVAVVDCSGALVDRAPMVVPWINPEAMAEGLHLGALVVPWAPSTLLASALGSLARVGVPAQVSAQIFLPASVAGRDGIEELSKQVVALFNAATPPRKVFSHGLAFDLLPQLGVVDDSGWTDQERRVVREVLGLTGLAVPLDVTLVGSPLFSGAAATVQIRTDRQVPVDLVERVLSDGGARMPESTALRHLPRPRRVEGQPFVHVARIREAHGSLHLWLSMDNLRATATVAVGSCGALVRQG